MAARRRGSRTAPKPEDPPPGLLREGNNFASLSQGTIQALLGKEANRTKKAVSYSQTLKSSDATAQSIDDLSKTEIETKLTNCVKTWWENYDEAMEKFREQNVGAPAPAPAPAAVAPPPYDYDALGADDLRNLTVKRMSFKWAQNQSTTTYERTAPALRKLLRDQAADPSQWAIVAQHEGPAPKHVETTMTAMLTKGLLDADTLNKWLRELTDGPQ